MPACSFMSRAPLIFGASNIATISELRLPWSVSARRRRGGEVFAPSASAPKPKQCLGLTTLLYPPPAGTQPRHDARHPAHQLRPTVRRVLRRGDGDWAGRHAS